MRPALRLFRLLIDCTQVHKARPSNLSTQSTDGVVVYAPVQMRTSLCSCGTSTTSRPAASACCWACCTAIWKVPACCGRPRFAQYACMQHRRGGIRPCMSAGLPPHCCCLLVPCRAARAAVQQPVCGRHRDAGRGHLLCRNAEAAAPAGPALPCVEGRPRPPRRPHTGAYSRHRLLPSGWKFERG